MMKVTHNNEKNGIEVRFENKPEQAVLDVLRNNGFRWSNKQKMWYAKQSEEVFSAINNLDSSFIPAKSESAKPKGYNLWDTTRTKWITNNYEESKLTNTKEIVSIIRKHIKERFPMCKFSVRSDYNSITIYLLASPFEKDGDEIDAIIHYVKTFAESYNYDNSDSMTDYFDVNFYLSCHVSYLYEKREMTEEIREIIATFADKKAEYEQAEEARMQKEHEEYLKQREEEEKRYQELERQRKINHQAIESSAEVKNLDKGYFLCDLISPNCNKMSNVSEIESQIEEGNYDTVVCNVTREVYMTYEMYNLFKNMLLDDFSFLEGMGGSRTDDNRISTMADYGHMTEEERKTVEWYNYNCVAIFCDGRLVMVCDPQGYGYARYAFIPGEKTNKRDEYVTSQVITSEQLEEYKAIAESLEDRSFNIITENGWIGTWNEQNFSKYRKAIVNTIKDKHIKFDKNVVRAISDEGEFKSAMYRILETPEETSEQFADAGFADGEKISVIKFDDCIGGVQSYQAIYHGYEKESWGGKDIVKIAVTLPNKRGEYTMLIKDSCLIVSGWIEIPRNLLWENLSSVSGLRCEKTKFLSFDRKQLDVVVDWLRSTNKNIVINTYKPIFD